MKKLLAFLLALSMLFALAACGGNEDANRNKEEETTEAPKPATLEEALANTAAELEGADNLTIKLTADVKSDEDFGDLDETVSMDMKVHLDRAAKEFSALAEVELEDKSINYYIHDGNGIFYDEEAEAYYKTDVSDQLDTAMGADTEPQSIEDMIDQLPAETLAMVEEYVDLEKLVELANNLDEAALTEQLNYSTTTNGDTITHSYKPELVSMVKTVLEQLKEAFENEIYYGILTVIDNLAEQGDVELTLEMDQIDDKINTLRIAAALVDPDDYELFAVDCSIELSDIGTTEVDLEELDSILAQAVEAPTGPVMGEGSIVGMVEDNSYYNEYMALGCYLDEESWAVASAEEACMLMGLSTSDQVSAEEVLNQVGYFYDFYALYADEMSSINIVVTKETEDSLSLTDEELNTNNAVSIAPALESVGYSNVQVQEAIIGFAGADYNGLLITAEAGDVILYETQVMIRFGDYIMTITAASFMEDLTGEFLSYFYSV